MKLQRQLMLVSLLMLIVPWAGCQYVREIDGAIRYGQEQALEATARAVAAALAAEPLLFGAGARIAIERSDLPPLYLAGLAAAPLLDGYDEEWSDIAPHLLDWPAATAVTSEALSTAATAAVAWRAAVWRDTLYLMVGVRDPSVVYFNPSLATDNGDRLQLNIGDLQVDISTSAPGSLRGRLRDSVGVVSDEARIAGHWNATADGYSVELAIPVELAAGRLGATLIDVDGAGNERQLALTEALPMRLVFPIASLQERLALFARPGLRLRAVDREGWLRGDAGRVDDVESAGANWLLRLFYRTLLPDGERLPAQATVGLLQRDEVQRAVHGDTVLRWYRQDGRSQRQLLSAATPVVAGDWTLGAVIAEQSSEPYLLRTDQAFARLLFYSALTLLVTGLGLFGYAGWLSQRIRRLSRAAAELLDDDFRDPRGNWRSAFPASQAQDELGDLSRNYAQLLARLREYTDYLRTLARKLSHELRTPLAIVHSSLDNLDSVLDDRHVDADSRLYLQRAREGAQRLSHILTAMSAASRVEESIAGAELEQTRLAPLLSELCRAYADLYRDHRLIFAAAGDDVAVLAAPELIVQMLDKLVENAADFTPTGASIEIALQTLADRVVIEVANDGPPLPAQMQHQLFDSMVSLREREGDATHLGLGLYIVRLIAEAHGGRVRASNRDDASGVCFRIELPRADLHLERRGGAAQ